VFQVKCLSRIREFQQEGRTIVFVTHDADTVRRVCDRAVVLDHGDLVLDGGPGQAIRALREHLHGGTAGPVDDRAEHAIGDVRTSHVHQAERAHLVPGETLTVEADLHLTTPIEKAVLALEIGDRTGRPIYRNDTDGLGRPLGRVAGPRTVRFTVGNVWLLDGEFSISLKLSDQTTGEVVDWRESVSAFSVASADRAEGTIALDVRVD
jgi:ABC-2 type transport system ATP-binding protein